jgi:NarL family two-component system response regulator LiaR
MQTIRVFLVDDHAVVRQGLRAFLQAFDDLALIGEAESGEAAIQSCTADPPDVILMDMIMPGLDGVAATRAILQAQPAIRVIALTSFVDDSLVQQVIQAGAISYLLKSVEADELAAAIRAAHAGQSILAPEATQALIRAATQEPEDYDLTPRELQVLALMVEGLKNSDIADRLVISESTVKFHVSGTLSKLGVSRRTEAITLALEKGLVDRTVLPPKRPG